MRSGTLVLVSDLPTLLFRPAEHYFRSILILPRIGNTENFLTKATDIIRSTVSICLRLVYLLSLAAETIRRQTTTQISTLPLELFRHVLLTRPEETRFQPKFLRAFLVFPSTMIGGKLPPALVVNLTSR